MERTELEVDGSIFEGGGQIMRVSLCISALLEKSLRMRNVRVGRPKPGLAHSHLAALKSLAKITKAHLDQVRVGTREFTFQPTALETGHYTVDCDTAGSISLMFQCLFPVLLKTGSQATLRGGTDVSFSPPTFFVINVLKPTLAKMGIDFEYRVIELGFQPGGGGEVHVSAVQTDRIQPLVLLEKGEIQAVSGEVILAKGKPNSKAVLLDRGFGERVSEVMKECLRMENVEIVVREVEDVSRCAVVNLLARTTTGCLFHASSLGLEKRIDPERLGRETALALLKELEGANTVDSHLQDQTVIFMALATGESRVIPGELTEHTKGALHLVETMLGARVRLEDSILTIEGVGR